MENKYTKLPIPDESAWSRKDWRYYSPIWLNKLIDSLENLIDWLPTIWKDRHWDDYYIIKLLQRKIELQRKYIVSNNRHLNVPSDNYWMTVLLNLLEREHEDYYEEERYYLINFDLFDFFVDDVKLREQIRNKVNDEALKEYVAKYPSTVRKIKAKFPTMSFDDNIKRLAMYVGIYNQQKCRNLIFEILKQKSELWWD
jgi:hypothetical protein